VAKADDDDDGAKGRIRLVSNRLPNFKLFASSLHTQTAKRFQHSPKRKGKRTQLTNKIY